MQSEKYNREYFDSRMKLTKKPVESWDDIWVKGQRSWKSHRLKQHKELYAKPPENPISPVLPFDKITNKDRVNSMAIEISQSNGESINYLEVGHGMKLNSNDYYAQIDANTKVLYLNFNRIHLLQDYLGKQGIQKIIIKKDTELSVENLPSDIHKFITLADALGSAPDKTTPELSSFESGIPD